MLEPAGTIVLETEQLTMQGGSALKAADLPLSQGNAGSIDGGEERMAPRNPS